MMTSFDASALAISFFRCGIALGCNIVSSPSAATSLASRDARLIRVEICLGKRCRTGKFRHLLVVEVVGSGMDAIDLGESDLIVIECLGDTTTLVKQPIRSAVFAKRDLLDRRGFSLGGASVSPGCALHQHTIRAEHRAIRIDNDARLSKLRLCRRRRLKDIALDLILREPPNAHAQCNRRALEL
jgi:hypothetical protein